MPDWLGETHVVRDHAARSPGGFGRHPAGHRLRLQFGKRRCSRSDAALAPAAADEVSALTAMQFAAHGQRLYQAVSAQAAAIHQLFVQAMQVSAGSYAATEAANAAATG